MLSYIVSFFYFTLIEEEEEQINLAYWHFKKSKKNKYFLKENVGFF
jgi:hypothetical protein